jgi:hypothetical protein
VPQQKNWVFTDSRLSCLLATESDSPSRSIFLLIDYRVLKSSACMTTYLTWGRDFPCSCHSRASFLLDYLAVSRQLRDDISQSMTIPCLNYQTTVFRPSDFRVKRRRRDGVHWSSSNTWVSNTFTLFNPSSWHETLLALVQHDQDDQPLQPTRCTGYRVIAVPDHTQTHHTQ